MLEFKIVYCGAPHDHIVHAYFEACETHRTMHAYVCNGVG